MRYLLLLLVACCGFAEDLPLGLGPIAPFPMGVEAPLGLGAAPTTSQAIAAANFSNLNDPALTTFTRTTSAWDPVNNAIKYANQRRQRTFAINGTNYSADLIESARTNILASGTSEHFERWTVGSGTPVVTTDTLACPNAEVVADTLTEGVGTGTQGVSQSAAKAASSLAYVASCYIKNKTGSREVAVDLDDGTLTNGVQLRINPATGALTSAPAAFGSGWAVNTTAGTSGYTITDAGSGWYRVSIVATSDATTTVRFRVALYNAADSYAGDGTSAIYLWGADANQATFAATVCLCRNLLLQSETLGTSWTATRSSVSSNSTADPITGNTTADTITEDSTVTSTHFVRQNFTKATSALQFTFSTYLKQSGRTWALVQCADSGATNGAGMYFDLANGAKGTSAILGSGWTLDASHITAVSGGWYRCDITVTSDTSNTIQPLIGAATGNGGKTYTGTGIASLICWGNQLEYGSTLTQYWATTTAGLRTADVLLSTLTSITDARTNRLTYSEQFDNANWTKTDVTVTTNSGTDPNGNGYCDLLTEGAAGTATTSQAGTITAASTVAYSVYLKRSAVVDWVRIQAASNSNANGVRAWFNLSTGAKTDPVAIGTGTATSSTITDVGNGWYRCSIIGTVDAASASATCLVKSAANSASATPVASSAYYAFGAQLEQASSVGDYIPVGGTAITTGPTGLSRTTGTLVSIVMPRNWTGDQDASTAYRFFGGSDTNASGFRRNNATTVFGARGDVGGSEFNAPASSTPTNGALTLYSVTWSPSAVNAGYNGATFAQDATLQAPFDAVTSATIGSAAAGANAGFCYSLHLYSHQQVVPGSTLALMYAATTAP